jgi:hypothetical protein
MVMHRSKQFDSQSLAPLGGTTTRARAGFDNTAQPPLTSGFGAVMEQEEDIQSSTEGYVGGDNGPNSAAIDRILRHQGTRLGANIALLEQRYEMLPHPARFQTLHGKHARLSNARHTAAADDLGVLPSLVAKHLDLLRKIETLMSRRPDGQRGELILAEIARNHEEMAWMLTALIKEDESVRDFVPTPVIASAPASPKLSTSEANWENEGGASGASPVAT